MYFSYILIKYAIFWHVVENVFGKWNVIGYAVVIYVFTILSGIIFFVLLKFLVFHIRLSKCMRPPSVLIRFTTILFLFLTFKVILKLKKFLTCPHCMQFVPTQRLTILSRVPSNAYIEAHPYLMKEMKRDKHDSIFCKYCQIYIRQRYGDSMYRALKK